jgi:indolepyruvate decarboxylase
LSITDNVIVIADVGDSLFGALNLTIHGQTHFLSPAYYSSMGFAVPAAIGAQLANPILRPIVIVGDGAFQNIHTCKNIYLLLDIPITD